MVSSSLYYISYIWGGVFLMLISESLFKEEGLKYISKVFIIIAMIFSVFIISTNPSLYTSQDAFYDGSFFIMIAYSSYILIKACLRKRKRAVLLCIGSFIMYFGAFHDILIGSGAFYSEVGEINAYTYFIFLLIFSYALSQSTKEYQLSIFNSELNFLHAQIQPHFLFNTINTIITYCRQEPDLARELLLDLSTYLRGKFDYDSENMEISLKEEIELIKSYLTIEKVRFGDRLQVLYDIDEDINITVPCLIFQPLVENAVKHGLKDNIKGVKIQILVKKIENYISLQVKDNGKGIDQNTLLKLLKQESTGVGINNTSKRLKLYYNTDLMIESNKSQGTCITIKIPKGGKKC
jgi:sensor histidine kinase YesM